MHTLYSFYRSEEWELFRKLIIEERTKPDGFIYDEVTGKPILHRYDLILHHKIELTEENVNDVNISLNPDNIMVISHKTHNKIHGRFCGGENAMRRSIRKAYIVYGPPLSGKTQWVRENKGAGDFVVDIDSIWQCISGDARYQKPKSLKQIAFKIRDAEIDAIKYRLGFWRAAYLIGGYPISAQRKRLAEELEAEEIFIDTPKEECLRRLYATDSGRDRDAWTEYIEEWFEDFTE